MIRHRLRIPSTYWPFFGALLLLVGLYLVSIPDLVLFHSLVEVFAIVISCAVFTLTWNTQRFLNHDYLLFVGIALLAASAINIAHTLSYKGMGVFPGEDANLPTQLWLARRYLESIGLLAALLFLQRRLNPGVALIGFGAAVAVLLASIFWHVFPVAYVQGTGLTPFKKVSEYIIAGLFLAAAGLLYRQRGHFEPDVWPGLVWALVIAAVAELLFTLYVDVYDLPNRIGHFLTIASYYLIYLAIVKTGIVRPYALLSTANASLRSEVSQREQAQAELMRQGEWLRSLHEIDDAILRAQSPVDIARVTVRSLVEVTEARAAAIVLCERETGRLELLAAAEAGQDLKEQSPLAVCRLLEEDCPAPRGTIPDVTALSEDDPRKAVLVAEGIRCYTSIPLVIAGQIIGTTLLGHAAPGPLAEAVLEFAAQVADQLAVSIRQAQLFDETLNSREQLRTLTHRLVAIQEDERKSLSRELHDRTGQSMTLLKLRLGKLKREASDSPAVQASVDELTQIADSVMEELHELAVSLRPVSLDRYGLVPALEQYLAGFRRQNSVEVGFMADGLDRERLPEEVETTLFRIVQESLTNVARHAGAEHAGVVLNRKGERVILVVEDDGSGFDVEEALRQGRLGLLGMRERAEMLGGTLTIESRPGNGTSVFVEVPCDR